MVVHYNATQFSVWIRPYCAEEETPATICRSVLPRVVLKSSVCSRRNTGFLVWIHGSCLGDEANPMRRSVWPAYSFQNALKCVHVLSQTCVMNTSEEKQETTISDVVFVLAEIMFTFSVLKYHLVLVQRVIVFFFSCGLELVNIILTSETVLLCYHWVNFNCRHDTNSNCSNELRRIAGELVSKISRRLPNLKNSFSNCVIFWASQWILHRWAILPPMILKRSHGLIHCLVVIRCQRNITWNRLTMPNDFSRFIAPQSMFINSH